MANEKEILLNAAHELKSEADNNGYDCEVEMERGEYGGAVYYRVTFKSREGITLASFTCENAAQAWLDAAPHGDFEDAANECSHVMPAWVAAMSPIASRPELGCFFGTACDYVRAQVSRCN